MPRRRRLAACGAIRGSICRRWQCNPQRRGATRSPAKPWTRTAISTWRRCLDASPSRCSFHALADDHRRRVHRVADPRHAVHAGDRLSRRSGDRSARGSFHPRPRVDVPHDAQQGNSVEVLTNGNEFYPAMLDAIRHARETINFECYIFKKGDIGDRFVTALSERARDGVRVTIVMDAIGSFGSLHRAARPLRQAGCRVALYQRMRWYSLARLNNRTHRELLVVDGDVAFVGGAGVADWWWHDHKHKPMWRDTMVRIRGPVVSDIQGVVAENWLECCGEILTSAHTYKPHVQVGHTPAFAI